MAAVAPRAEAAMLAPGSTVPALPNAFPGGTQLASVYYSNQSEADLTVSFGAAVYRNAGGTLDFYYQVTNNSPAPTFDEVHRVTTSSFFGFTTDVSFVTNGGSIPAAAAPGGSFSNGTQDPVNIDRSGSGSVVGFNFPTGFEVNAGETSVVLMVRTNAVNFVPGNVSVINSGTVTRPAFAPSVVPEPASLAMVGVGLLAAGRRRRRRA
jgi:hypothetical protein